ncbi:fatty acid desaturase [Lentilitoribacter sp. EG35]|uniref:fatty acid desaturase n=1 Tax=Lentilitoribacter sp. EG35 TaxID=3234192 RepID=UPI00345FB375
MSDMVRDYELLGKGADWAKDQGLVGAKWYRTDVSKDSLRSIMKRKDQPAIRDTLIWFTILICAAWGGVYFWGTIWCVPFWLIYGVFYGSAADSRWHECGHSTAFKTPWMNKFVYHIACFMMIRNPVVWRHSHRRHHSDTIIVGRDPEIAIMRPVDMMRIIANFFGIIDAYEGIASMIRISVNGLNAAEKSYVPEKEERVAINTALIWLIIYLITILIAIGTMSLIPLMLIGLPRLYGAWHHVMTGLLQHGGLAENVIDHRLNSRTVLMNPISRFIYWNMNYHIEHHMFLMVPYHALPQLHEMLKHDLPAPNPSILDAYREMMPVLIQQMRNERIFIERELPDTAQTYLRV